MGARVLKNVFLVAVLVFATGCDPETMVRNKVPGWLQSLLGAQPRKAGATTAKGPTGPSLKILGPTNNEVFPVGKRVAFRAEGKLEGGQPAVPKDLVWKVKGQKIGNGPSVSKQFPAGKYQADLTMVLPGQKTISQKVSFRVANLLTGTILFDGKGLAGTKVVLESAESVEVAAESLTKKDGTFALEIPAKGAFRVVPRKKGFSFNPPSLDVRHTKEAQPVKFTAAKGGITDIKLTATEDSETPLAHICPEQVAYLKANISSEAPVTKLQVIMIPTSGNNANQVVLGEAVDSSEIPDRNNPNAPKGMKVRLSEYFLKEEDMRHPFRLQLTAHDEKGNAFSAVAKDTISIDMVACLSKWLADGASQHAGGDAEAALQAYGMLEKYKKLVPDITKVSEQFARCFFDRGLAYADLGVSGEKSDFERSGYLAKAAHSFGSALEHRSTDPQTILLMGWVNYLNKDYQRAIEQLSEAIKLLPQSANLYEMRADAYVMTRRLSNLSKAVDDYTRALRVDSHRFDLRKSRREALKLDIKHAEKSENAELDVSSVPLADLKDKLNVKEFIRK